MVKEPIIRLSSQVANDVNQKAESTTTRTKANPERWQRLKNMLADALEKTSVEERTAILTRSCADDKTLLREAEKLLAHDATAFEDFAEFAAARLRHDERDRIGERIGAYAIVRELGRGGMGAVYLAERADGQFKKRVAVKVLKRGTDTDEVLRRFRMERQILANLEHSNITRLLDAGTTADGLPYFVMEFVEGIPITRFVEQANVDVRDRLNLFLKVCAAVALAHRHQVIHRDIKPRNVLVNQDGEPKLLDFGIAKLLDVDSDDIATTVAAERRLTPMYAAPEQRAGHAAAMATDVYSLGALLYELLTARPPRSSSNGDTCWNGIGTGESIVGLALCLPHYKSKPQLPSEIVTDPNAKRQLQGQLDQIVAKAMQPDPARRYSSATGLSEDIEHYLNPTGPVTTCYPATPAGSRPRWYIAAMAFAAVSLATALLLPLRRNVSKPETVNAATNLASESSTNAATVPSIAVLPFENLSEEKENAYFADGVQEDILTNLAKIGDLKVISRTSVMGYRGKTSNVREIGKALGVSTVLEGSVRRAGNRVRVSVQLINAENDGQIWAQEYDRDLADVFAIQTDLSQKIARELQAKLSPAEKARITRKPTENSEAYLAFVQARNLQNAYGDLGKLKQSEQLYARAVELDPKFALAMGRYSQLESWIVHSFERTLERREKARILAERALELQPDQPDGHLALGYSYYYGDQNYDAALREFEIAQRGLPNEAEVYLSLGGIQRRQGKWAESTANFEKAAGLNPRDAWALQNLAYNYWRLRDFDAANKTIDRALEIEPNEFVLWEGKAWLAITERADLSVAEKALAVMNPVPTSSDQQKATVAMRRMNLLLLLRKYGELLQETDRLPDDLAGMIPTGFNGKYYGIGIARKSLNDEAGARAAFLKAKSTAESELKQRPDDVDVHIQLARALAWLGEKGAALHHAQRAMELNPESKDAFFGPAVTAAVAEVHGIIGDNDRAIELLEGLLKPPSWLTAQRLKVDPVWDPLRNDPRFQALLNKYGSGG
jgi:serine/threonine protein kinase/cytochrome c-type biogenesis protein CcmH/NrfG